MPQQTARGLAGTFLLQSIVRRQVYRKQRPKTGFVLQSFPLAMFRTVKSFRQFGQVNSSMSSHPN